VSSGRHHVGRSFASLSLLGMTGFTANTSLMMIAPIIAVYSINRFNASVSDVGLIISAYYVSSALSRLPIGVSTGGRKALRALLLGLLILGICPIAYTMANSSASMALVRLVHGLGFSLFSTMGLTLASLISSEDELTETLGRYTLLIALGLVFGPAFGAISISLLGQHRTFILSSFIAFSGVLLSSFLGRRGIRRDSTQLETVCLREVPQVLTSRPFQRAFLAYFAFAFMWGVVLGYVPVRAQQDFQIIEAQITLLFFGYFLVLVSSRFFVGRLVGRFGEERVLTTGLLAGGVFTLLVSATVNPIHFSIAFVLLGVSHGIIFPTSAMIIAKNALPKNLVLANSLYLVSFDSGAMIGPLIASGVATLWGIRSALAVSAIPLFLNIPLSKLEKRTELTDD